MSWGTYVETYTQQCVDLQGHLVAVVLEGLDLCLVGCYAGRNGLLRLAVDELAEVEGPSHASKCLLLTRHHWQGVEGWHTLYNRPPVGYLSATAQRM